MEEKKNLCAPIPLSLHQRLRAEQEQRGQTLADYITDILNEHFEGGAKTMGNTNRTIAFQVPEELFDRLKDYLARNGLKQKDFILGLIERELNDAGGCKIRTYRAAGVCLRLYFWRNTMYLYPENLTARPMLWLWTLRDVAFIGIGLLLSVLALTQVGSIAPLVVTAVLAFLCIRHGGVSMLDFLRYAAAFFFFDQQYYEWREQT